MFYVVYDDEDVEHTVRTHTITGRVALWSFGLRVHEISQRKREESKSIATTLTVHCLHDT